MLPLNKLNQDPKKEAFRAVSLNFMADLTVYQGLLKSWNIDHLEVVEREKIIKKKPTLGKMGYQLGTTALNFQENYNAFRIRCIMLILDFLKN